jgi:hypothetical protein
MPSFELVSGFLVTFGAILTVVLTVILLKNGLCWLLSTTTTCSGKSFARPRKVFLVLIPLYLALILGLSIFASIPQFDRVAGVLSAAVNPNPIPPYAPTLHEEFPEITIVTFSSDGYTDALENAIGCFHVWASQVPIAVYDMGLSSTNVARIGRLAGVTVIPFNFSRYPPHVRYMHNYAFKPLLMLDAVERFGAILSLDAGVELRHSPRVAFSALDTVGYFFVEASGADPLTRVNPKTVAYLGMQPPPPDERQCYAGMQGYRRGTAAVEHVLKPTVACALDPACIDPPGSGHENHRYEQVVLSLYMRRTHLHCRVGRLFNEHLPTTLHPDPLALHQPQLFFFRRWRYPKPYSSLVVALPLGTEREGRERGGSLSAEQSASGGSLFENGVTDRKTSDVTFVRCLQDTKYDVAACEKLQRAWEGNAAGRARLGSAAYREEEEQRGWWLGQAARVYWAWPLRVSEAVVLVLLGTASLLVWLLRPQHIATPAAVAIVAVIALYWLRQSDPPLCSPGQPISFDLQKSDNGYLMSSRSRVQCPNMVVTTRPFFVRTKSFQYAFFATEALMHTVVTYASAPLAPAAAWTVAGVALVSPEPLRRPCVFTVNDSHFMLPTMTDSNRVQLLTTAKFPADWHVLRDLLTFSQPVAPMLYHMHSRWYLLVSADHGRTNSLYESMHLLGPFVPAARSSVMNPAAAVCRDDVDQSM